MRSHLRGTPFASRAVQAAQGSSSLRVTIPQVIAATLGLRAGDQLLWHLDVGSGEVRVEAQPARPHGHQAAPARGIPRETVEAFEGHPARPPSRSADLPRAGRTGRGREGRRSLWLGPARG